MEAQKLVVWAGSPWNSARTPGSALGCLTCECE